MAYEAVPGKYVAYTIVASPATGLASADASFMDPTRWAIMRQGIVAAVSENSGSAFAGTDPPPAANTGVANLAQLRQARPAQRLVQSLYADSNPCNAGGIGKFGVYAPSVAQASYAQSAAPAGTVMVTPAANTGSSVATIGHPRRRQCRHHSCRSR